MSNQQKDEIASNFVQALVRYLVHIRRLVRRQMNSTFLVQSKG